MKYCSVTDQIFGIIRRLEEEKKKPMDYGGGILLGHAEVQFLETVARYPDENVSELSERLGITKGAVTQTVAKLAQKELLESIQREDNRQKKYFLLTRKGEEVIRSHQRHHRQANQRLCRFIAGLDAKEAGAVFRFLENVRECVPFCEFPCECEGDRGLDKEESHHETSVAACARPACRS
ncbi:MAG: MarR family transcriptional regulator [Candidatus Limiplasma sp.]|nr:MarR family transcriptional regulator [Candidatus Limiplasma sp.]